MRKKSRTKKLEPQRISTPTPKECEEMAWSLVHRGLTSPAITEKSFTKKDFNRGTRPMNYNHNERK